MDRGHILENIVYLELKRRGYEIYVGKFDDQEIDFVVKNQNDVYYLQVAETIKSQDTLDRELAPLKAVNDFHRRVVITQDYDVNQSYEGIMVINLLEWLTQQVDFS